jgi:hypothetical protein
LSREVSCCRRCNNCLARADGTFRFSDNALVALAPLVAESEPKQKDSMIRLILNLLEGERARGGRRVVRGERPSETSGRGVDSLGDRPDAVSLLPVRHRAGGGDVLGERKRPWREDPLLDILIQRGRGHERLYVATLRGEGKLRRCGVGRRDTANSRAIE